MGISWSIAVRINFWVSKFNFTGNCLLEFKRKICLRSERVSEQYLRKIILQREPEFYFSVAIFIKNGGKNKKGWQKLRIDPQELEIDK